MSFIFLLTLFEWVLSSLRWRASLSSCWTGLEWLLSCMPAGRAMLLSQSKNVIRYRRRNNSWCRYLLRQGADPNGGRHEHGYTCLHFAGLAGEFYHPPAHHSTWCHQESQKYASSYWKQGRKPIIQTLSKGQLPLISFDEISENFRTAAAMAAFVGNHHCVSVINNHVPKDHVLYYTKWVRFKKFSNHHCVQEYYTKWVKFKNI